jgi:probable O-glycosylation ligase (exosortase A-associated)
MRDILLIAVVFGGCLIALFRPPFGILLFTFLGFFNPHSMTWGIGRTVPLSLLVAVCTIVGYVIWSEPKQFPKQRELLLLVTLWCLFGISTLFAISQTDAIPKYIFVSKIFLIVVLSTAIMTTKNRVLSLLRVIALPIGFFAAKGGFFAIITGGNHIVYGPDPSFLAANNSIGLAMAMNVPLLAYLAKIENRQWLKQIMRAMLVLSYPAVVCTYSRGAWLGLAMATFLIVFKSRHRFVTAAATGIVIAILIPLLSHLAPTRLTQRYDTLANYEKDASAESRFWNWEFCRRVGTARPLTGGGFDFYSIRLYATYYPEFLERWPGKFWSCHSMWLTVLGEHGIVGFLLWLALMFSALVSLRRIRAYASSDAQFAWMSECADALQGGLVAFMVVGTFLDTAYFDMYYFLIGIVVIMKEMIRRRSQSGPIVEGARRAMPSITEQPSLLRVG